MCGIVGAIAQRNVVPILLEGLKRLEYRGYDSAGVVVLNAKNQIERTRVEGKVSKLVTKIQHQPIKGSVGLAHTRWATHGKPNETNAHPHISNNEILLVHNGIIENYADLRQKLAKDHYKFSSETDTEVIAHLIHKYFTKTKDIFSATKLAVKELHGAFALGIMAKSQPDRIIAARLGSPLILGLGIEENFIASDQLALLPVTQNFIYLEEGDVAELCKEKITIYDSNNRKVKRPTHTSSLKNDTGERGQFKHYMQKEIFTQANAITDTLEGKLSQNKLLISALGGNISKMLKKVQHIQIIACGTSYHAGMLAKHWLEDIARIPCQVDIASEIRYRNNIVSPNTLLITISQSGETADTLAALRKAKAQAYLSTLTISNVPESSTTRESEYTILTQAGPEIGVASTKAFTTQLVVLLMLTATLQSLHAENTEIENAICLQLKKLPNLINEVLKIDNRVSEIAKKFIHKNHAIFLGRGYYFPLALEGALKLKEISYIHAEGYPAGELKHGPLALIDEKMPVIVIAPSNALFEKTISNINEVKARGGQVFVITDKPAAFNAKDVTIIPMPKTPETIAPIIYTIPLQLLAYHVAVLKGTDIDQPRNLAKSVTVE